MAAGDLKTFRDYPLKAGRKLYDNDNDVFKYALLTNDYASVNVDTQNPNLSTYTEVTAGGNYTLGGNTLTGQDWTRTGAVTAQKFADFNMQKNAGNPTGAKTMLIINSTAGNDAYNIIDLTADGTTAVDLVNNDLSVTFNASGTMNITVSA